GGQMEQTSSPFVVAFVDPDETSAPILRRRGQKLTRLMWLTTAIFAGGVFLAALPAAVMAIEQGAYLQGHQGTIANNPEANPTTLDIAVTFIGVAVGLTAALVSLILAIIIFWRKSDDQMALFVSFYLLLTGLINNGPLELMEFYIPGIAVFTTDVLTTFCATTLVVALLALFPDGRFIPRWIRWLPLASSTMLPLALYGYIRYGQFLTSPLMFLALPVWSVTILLAFYSQVYRYRHVSSTAERQQTKWIIYGFGLALFLSLLSAGPYIEGRNLSPGESLPLWFVLFGVATYLPSLIVIPAALTIAVLRYRLWDIDILINRTLVYGALTVSIVIIYVLVVGSLSALVHSGGGFAVSLLATGIVAVLFQPIRERLQRRVNRMMFGKRDEPYLVLERLSERLDLVVQTEQILPTTVETVAEALKLPYVAITLQKSGESRTAAEFRRSADIPMADDEYYKLPLIYQSETVGQLILAPRGRGENFSQAETQLLETIARQTSIAAYNVRLTDELKQSREQLVTTREEERRRLRRDLHDGLGPVLATISVGMDAISNLAENPQQTREVALEVKAQAQKALEDIRRIAYNLRPPALDELGLVAALKQHIVSINHTNGLQIYFHAPERLPALSAAIELAAYRIVLEAVNNVLRHANAKWCHVLLTSNTYLVLQITDDGCGIANSYVAGIGLHSMRERAAELSGFCSINALSERGGTVVLAQLPLPDNRNDEAN
ncbi:MAG: histidine kinase, partial [Chloroflexi bacterium]|nr:histidine kinase [Chloroflexota bacterium]